MKRYQDYATLLLRIAMAIGFLSAVLSRLGFLGKQSSGWENFLAYAEEVNSFLPKSLIPSIAIFSTFLESLFAVLFLVGYQTRKTAIGASILTFLFALAMTYSFGIKEPLDYSDFVFSMGAFLLSTADKYRWSLDEYLLKIN
ncbi:Uncharacterized membrane protein YphA, DoxX/SURF4 family [Flavobacterium resistens]|uniref:DoxX protein n=1 Tax=Flavobacterium resistens TaxID=443612 RepID=A0A521F1K3_9FLAO|nr:DoxX family protein [Flavobacterium resistens]MRX69393.1 DoxX protein [Flavobacterium resistens]SMO90065.1 Uncharacterized membrane protein YphA, DoxX/SURF4 family [Flavobacterium resistens]